MFPNPSPHNFVSYLEHAELSEERLNLIKSKNYTDSDPSNPKNWVICTNCGRVIYESLVDALFSKQSCR
jgi:hypothetical protein